MDCSMIGEAPQKDRLAAEPIHRMTTPERGRHPQIRDSILCCHLGGEHPLCRFQLDKGIGIEMCGNDVCPLVQDLMQYHIAFHIEDGDRATPDTGVDMPAHPSCFILSNPWPEGLPKLYKIGRSFGPWRRDDKKHHNGDL